MESFVVNVFWCSANVTSGNEVDPNPVIKDGSVPVVSMETGPVFRVFW